MGPNGAGKSTLLSLITGDHPQGYNNELHLFGRRRAAARDLGDQAPHRAREPGAASGLSCQLPVQTVILSGFYDPSGFIPGRGSSAGAANQWLALGWPIRAQPFPLSFGQQRLVLIARALVKHPPLLILDEPCRDWIPLSRHLVREMVARLVGEGTQLLFVSHHADDAPPV